MKNELPLISIIIPVYKVEKYLDRCVNSVVNQTYKNLEIILVDDGSPDNCPSMCDEWADKDSRIKVIHKENGGLSSARNAALDIMNGEYLMLVDSDDYLALNAVELMYKRVTADGSDMAICNYICVDENGSFDYWDNSFPVKDEVIDKAKAHKKNTASEYWHYVIACCKLYKAFLFNDIRFPEGRLHEDMFTSHYIFDKCNTVSCLSDRLYYYFQNSESITHFDTEKSFDIVDSYIERYNFYYKSAYYTCAADNLWNMIFKLVKYKYAADNDEAAINEIKSYKEFYNKEVFKVLFKKGVKNRAELFAFALGYLPFRCVSLIKRSLKRF